MALRTSEGTLTPEGILQRASEGVRSELAALLEQKKTIDIRRRTPRDERVCELTIGMCILEHAAEILINPEAFND